MIGSAKGDLPHTRFGEETRSMSGKGRKRFGFTIAAIVAAFSMVTGAMLAPASSLADEAVSHPAHIHNGDCSAPGQQNWLVSNSAAVGRRAGSGCRHERKNSRALDDSHGGS